MDPLLLSHRLDLRLSDFLLEYATAFTELPSERYALFNEEEVLAFFIESAKSALFKLVAHNRVGPHACLPAAALSCADRGLSLGERRIILRCNSLKIGERHRRSENPSLLTCLLRRLLLGGRLLRLLAVLVLLRRLRKQFGGRGESYQKSYGNYLDNSPRPGLRSRARHITFHKSSPPI
jgi:hypothetical protein